MHRPRARFTVGLALTIVAGLVAGDAAAQQQPDSAESRLRDALRRTTLELRALQDANATQKVALDEATKQRDLYKASTEELQARLAEVEPMAAMAAQLPVREAEVADLQQAVQALQSNTQALQQGLQQWQVAYEEAATVARSKEAERRDLETRLTQTTRVVEACEEKNDKLVVVAQETLQLYQSEDFLSVLTRSYEPVLGLAKVEVETILQDYEDRILDQKFYRSQVGEDAPPAAPAAAEPAPEGGTATEPTP